MKILILVGSYRKNGNTDQIVRLIAEQLSLVAAEKQAPLEIETVYLARQEIQPCRGCRVCFDRGEEKCPCKDDMLAIKAKMQAADGILAAAPVYVDDINGITKNWIDRLAHLCHRPGFAGKCAFVVVTVASSPVGHSLRTLSMALRFWGFHLTGQAGFKMGALMKSETTSLLFQKRAEKIARKLFTAIYQRTYARPSFVSLMMFKIYQWSWQRETMRDTLDYQYWNHQGWFERGCTFYIPHQANPIIVALARLTGSVITRFVT